MEVEMLSLITGPLGALALSVGILWWLANRILPVLTKYFDGHNEKLGQLVSALEKTVDAHEKDRETFTQTIAGITQRLVAVEDKVETIHKKLVSQN
jgi:ABC-type transporter Mla subunit MlaD